tara:strand:+ start:174 stop:371 length:198 start_codon:yes stop_codon:yes gene_type:complete
MKNEMKINVKVNEKNILEETYTIKLNRGEIEQVEQALLDLRMNLMETIESARGEIVLQFKLKHLI